MAAELVPSWATTCVPAAELEPLLADALSSIECAIARERSRSLTVALLRAQSDVKKLLDMLPSGDMLA